MGNTLYFEPFTDGELWKSDGTGQGTVRVKDIYPGEFGSNLSQLTAVGNTLYFTAHDGVAGMEVWKSDGTANGTVMVKDIQSGASNDSPFWLTAAGNLLYFTVDDGVHGVELWRSDGTPTGTFRLADINPGSGDSDPAWLTAFGGTLYFQASDPSGGAELWKTNGTAAGTVRVADVWPGSMSSSPANLHAAGKHLFFTAFPGDGSTTLFSLERPSTLEDLPPTGLPPGEVLAEWLRASKQYMDRAVRDIGDLSTAAKGIVDLRGLAKTATTLSNSMAGLQTMLDPLRTNRRQSLQLGSKASIDRAGVERVERFLLTLLNTLRDAVATSPSTAAVAGAAPNDRRMVAQTTDPLGPIKQQVREAFDPGRIYGDAAAAWNAAAKVATATGNPAAGLAAKASGITTAIGRMTRFGADSIRKLDRDGFADARSQAKDPAVRDLLRDLLGPGASALGKLTADGKKLMDVLAAAKAFLDQAGPAMDAISSRFDQIASAMRGQALQGEWAGTGTLWYVYAGGAQVKQVPTTVAMSLKPGGQGQFTGPMTITWIALDEKGQSTGRKQTSKPTVTGNFADAGTFVGKVNFRNQIVNVRWTFDGVQLRGDISSDLTISVRRK